MLLIWSWRKCFILCTVLLCPFWWLQTFLGHLTQNSIFISNMFMFCVVQCDMFSSMNYYYKQRFSAMLIIVFPNIFLTTIQIAKFMGPTWGPPGSCRSQMGPMLAPWALLSGYLNITLTYTIYISITQMIASSQCALWWYRTWMHCLPHWPLEVAVIIFEV